MRLPATGGADDYSTKIEGQAVLEGAKDVLPGLPPGSRVRVQTDSAAWDITSPGSPARLGVQQPLRPNGAHPPCFE